MGVLCVLLHTLTNLLVPPHLQLNTYGMVIHYQIQDILTLKINAALKLITVIRREGEDECNTLIHEWKV